MTTNDTPPKPRPTWDAYFLAMAGLAATRGTCDRKRVGCVIVRDRAVLATGYNGSPSGTPHCDDVGHLIEDGHCIRTVHAEQNAVCQAARRGTALEGATAYVTCAPCHSCLRTLISSGIVRVVFSEPYRNGRLFSDAAEAGVEVVQFEGEVST